MTEVVVSTQSTQPPLHHDAAAGDVAALQEEITVDSVEMIFGMELNRLYKLAIKYYKGTLQFFILKNYFLAVHFLDTERSGNLQIDYIVRLRFMAYSKQVRYGSFKSEMADVGWFDLVGNDAK